MSKPHDEIWYRHFTKMVPRVGLIPRAPISRRYVQKVLRSAYSSLNKDVDAPLVSHLMERGLLANVTSPNLEEELKAGKKIKLYLGADPTASSLHVGNMVPLMVLLHFYVRGHNPIALVGGATGEVGDPSGRTTERQAIANQVRANNIEGIHSQMKVFLERGREYAFQKGFQQTGSAEFLNNADWWRNVTMLGFLGTYGRHIRVSQMLGRDSIKSRLNSEQGIGFNEFTYQVLQAYDFWHLYSNHECQLQIGGNDQWGNITAGIDLISRLRKDPKKEAYGATVPLLTTPSGEKFGKSAGNAVWLDSKLTKPYDLYQYFVKAPDSVVETYLKMFTFISLEEIEQIISHHSQDESLRYAQRRLATEVTDLVHGLGSGQRAELISGFLFPSPGSSMSTVTNEEILRAFEIEGLAIEANRSEIIGHPWKSVLSNILGISRSDAGRLLKGGGVYYGRQNVQVTNGSNVEESMVDGNLFVIRTGKSSYSIVKLL